MAHDTTLASIESPELQSLSPLYAWNKHARFTSIRFFFKLTRKFYYYIKQQNAQTIWRYSNKKRRKNLKWKKSLTRQKVRLCSYLSTGETALENQPIEERAPRMHCIEDRSRQNDSIHYCKMIVYAILLGIRMHIRCLTQSTSKVRNGEARTTPCCPPPRSRVSELSKSLGWWRASRFVSLLPCCLSSFCWAVNRLPYIWTRSGIARSSVLRVLGLDLHAIAPWHHERHVPEVRKLCINPYISIISPLRTDIHTYEHNLRLRPH